MSQHPLSRFTGENLGLMPTMERSTETAGGPLLGPPPGHGLLPALTICYHTNLRRIGQRALLGEVGLGRPALLSRAEPAFAAPGVVGGLPLSDSRLSRQPIQLLARAGGVVLDPRGSRTRVSFRGQLLSQEHEFSTAEVARGVVLALSGAVGLVLHYAAALDPGAGPTDFGLLGDNHLLQGVRRDIRSIADLDTPVLIQGETGTGKELVARALHECSRRAAGPFVAVNLGAIPPSLASAELFGVERGAFTGAERRHPGYFQLARGGTLFLDEVGEAPPEMQVLLLRAIDTGEVHALGVGPAQRVQVRIVAATDANLEAKIRDGSFRAPLLHRLASSELRLPTLRQRREDIGRLFVHFLSAELERTGEGRLLEPDEGGAPWLPLPVLLQLVEHDWPGNVRQLRNVAQQIAVARRGGAGADLAAAVERWLGPPWPGEPDSEAPAPAPTGTGAPWRKPAEVTGDELVAALQACRWDLKATAQRLQLSRTTLYALLERAPQIRIARDLSPEEIRACYQECQGDLDAMVQRLQVSRRALQRRLRALRLI